MTDAKTKQELLEWENFTTYVFEQASEAIVLCNAKGTIMRASKSARELCGTNPLLKPFDKIFRFQIVATGDQFSLKAHMCAGKTASIEVEFKRNNDEIYTLLLNATTLVGIEHQAIGIVVTLTNISERKLAERALEQSELRLQVANSHLEIVNEEIQVVNAELHEQSVELRIKNQELAELWAIAKKSEAALQTAHAELERRVAERTKDLAASVRHLQSEMRERELAETTLLDETAKRLLVVEALREKEQMLIQQNRQAAMGEMIGNIAHQWRQPLNTLGLITQKLGIFYGSPGFNKEYVDNSVARSMDIISHMSKTIDDFRDYFKPEKEKSDFCVNAAIRNTLTLLEGSLLSSLITIDIVELGAPVIYGYQNEFSQVFLNILNNAKDAIVEREIVAARITITIGGEAGSAVVTVADNAGGIPEEIINKVFDPYFTTKGPQQGTGIGLFMSKTIIEKNMGGRLFVRNTGAGAEFRIEVGNDSRN